MCQMAGLARKDRALTADDWMGLRYWFEESGRHELPWRLEPDPWRVLLAEVLLHRTRAESVERVYRNVLSRFGDPHDVVGQPLRWMEMTRSVGLEWRTKKFVSTCEELLRFHGGEVPSEHEDLMSLPGIGHYIAGAVRCFGFGHPEVLVDTNTIRLASRIADRPLSPANHRSRRVREAVARLSENGIAAPPEDNYALLDLAATVCHSRNPECVRCPVLPTCRTGRRLIGQRRSQPGDADALG